MVLKKVKSWRCVATLELVLNKLHPPPSTPVYTCWFRFLWTMIHSATEQPYQSTPNLKIVIMLAFLQSLESPTFSHPSENLTVTVQVLWYQPNIIFQKIPFHTSFFSYYHSLCIQLETEMIHFQEQTAAHMRTRSQFFICPHHTLQKWMCKAADINHSGLKEAKLEAISAVNGQDHTHTCTICGLLGDTLMPDCWGRVLTVGWVKCWFTHAFTVSSLSVCLSVCVCLVLCPYIHIDDCCLKHDLLSLHHNSLLRCEAATHHAW